MKRIKVLFILFSSAFSCLNVHAQDPHFSQYYNTPLFVNPANAGNGIEYMRATLIYRNWSSVASPFITEGFMIDKTVNRLGFGFLAVKNSAGAASLKQLNLSGVLNYNQPFGENNQVSGALQIGMLHKSFDPAEMTFDNQFNEDAGFDPALSSAEVFTYTSITRPDVGLGFMWQHGFGNKDINFKPFAGIAFAHINKPSETFIVSENKQPVKSTLNFGAGIMLKDNLELRPSVLYMTQAHFHELNFGTVASFIMENNNKFQVGLYDRINSALIIYAGYQINQIFIGTSYDINTTSLQEGSRGGGGFEITLSYIPKAKAKAKAPAPKKPTKSVAANKPATTHKAPAKTTEKPVEKTASVPEKPVVAEPKKEVAPQIIVTPAVEKPAVAIVTEPKPIVENKTEIKPAFQKDITPIEPKAATTVKESKTKVPLKLEQPAGRNTVTPKPNTTIDNKPEPEVALQKPNEAPLEFSNVKDKVSIEKTIPKTTEDKVAGQKIINAKVEPKLHTVYIDMNKQTVTPETKPEAENKVVDTDGDGIADNEDHCPYIKGGAKTQGCPDSDGDGIQDMMDECPMEPGTPEHFGCPDVKQTVDNSMLIKKFNNIEFQTGSSKIKTADIYDIIEYAIDLLYQYPNSRVILSGHTDSEGNDLFNMHLSEKRNLIVKNYMMKKGIAENRFQMVNYGETMPLKDNNTPQGRAKNRRVEVNIIKTSK